MSFSIIISYLFVLVDGLMSLFELFP